MLECVTPDEALKLILTSGTTEITQTESVRLCDAVGRTAAEDIISGEQIPSFNRSTVDGYALRARDTFGCSESLPAMLQCSGEILMGESQKQVLPADSCIKIPTGGMLPEGADAVIMLEYTSLTDDGFVCAEKPCAPYENVIRTGDDVKQYQVLIKSNSVITVKDTGVLAAAGKTDILVRRNPVVGIISTGDELVPADTKPSGSQMRDVNSTLLRALAEQNQCRVLTYPIVADNAECLETAVNEAVRQCDTVIVSGGSSVGERDTVCEVLSRIGEIIFHGIAVKPGKPTMFATVSDKAVFGLPGHPLAAYFAARLFVIPYIYKILGKSFREQSTYAVALYKIPSNHGREEILPVKLCGGEGSDHFEPVYSKSGIISVLSGADGYIRIDRNTEGIEKDEKVQVYLF